MKKINAPCAIGDTVYKITSNGKIVSLVVNGIQLTENGGYASCKQNRSVVTIPFDAFGIWVFTSRYKAQQYMKHNNSEGV